MNSVSQPSQPSRGITIPSEIQALSDAFPKDREIQVRPGPTFLELKRKITQQIRFWIYVIIGTLLWLLVSLVYFKGTGRLVSSVLAGIALFFGVVMLISDVTTKSHLVVIDYATKMLYVGPKDIEFEAIQTLELTVHQDTYDDSEHRTCQCDFYGLVLRCNNPDLDTSLFRFYTNEAQYWGPIGEFFQKELSKQLHREIPYTSEPKRYDSQPIVEYCTYYNNHIDNFELKSGEPKK